MSYQLPPLNWLRAFDATARHLSFTQAAVELNLSQAAVSKQVKLLELRMGQQLFIRHARRLEMTKPALAYLPVVRAAFDRLAVGTHEVFGPKRDDRLTIRVSVAFAVTWLARSLQEFRVQYPEVRLRVMSDVWAEMAPEEPCDFDIRYGEGEWAGKTSYRLTREQVFPVCHPDTLANGALQQPEDLADHTLIQVMGYLDGWANWLRHAGLGDLSVTREIEVDTSLLAFELAKSQSGIALARSSLVDPALKAGQLVRPFDLDFPSTEAFFLTQANDHNLHPNAALFRDWLLQKAQSGVRTDA